MTESHRRLSRAGRGEGSVLGPSSGGKTASYEGPHVPTFSGESVARLAAYLTDVVCHVAADGTLLYVSPSCREMLGYSADELVGTSGYLNIHPDDRQRIGTAVASAGASESQPPVEYRMRRKDGTLVWVEATWRKLHEAGAGEAGQMVVVVRNIQRRKEAEQDRARLAALVQSTDDAIIGSTPEGVIESWNAAAERMYGYTEAEIVGRPIDVLVFLDRAGPMAEQLAQIRRGRRIDHFQAVHCTKQGRELRVSVRLSPVKDETGKLIGLSMIARDVGRERDIEKALQQRESLLREAGRIARVGGWEYDVRSGELAWTEEVYRIHEVPLAHRPSAEEAVDFYAPEARPIIRQAVRAAAERGKPFDVELPLITAKGAHRWIHAIGRPVTEDGRVVKVAGIFQDVTERKRSERELVQSERRYRLLFEMESDALFMIERDSGRILMANPSAARMYGYSQGALEQMKIVDLSAEPEKTSKTTGEEFATTVPLRYHRKQDGTVFPVEISIRTFLWEGRLVHLEAIRDISRRLKDQEALRAAKDEAEAANRSKSEFLANVSHEIRTPMTAILGFADLLADPRLPGDTRKRHVATIQKNGRTLLRLINDILDLSKIEAGRIDIKNGPVALPVVVDDVLSVVLPELQRKELWLRVAYDSSLPSVIQTDAVRLRQILVNLVGNAVKFTEQGSVTITSRSTAASGGGRTVEITVADTGIGIGRDRIGEIFEPFTQIDSSDTRRFGGTGLGLAVSRRLARMLGGDIEVQSEPGVGSVFHLTLQAADSGEDVPWPSDLDANDWAPLSAAAERSDREKPVPVLRGRLLLAEDVPDIQRLVACALANTGLELDVASNGREACEMVLRAERQRRPYDLILMDMQMPEMNGYEAAARLRRQGWRGAIVALTAHAMNGDEDRCRVAGCDDYLPKPVQFEHLLDCVRRYLGS